MRAKPFLILLAAAAISVTASSQAALAARKHAAVKSQCEPLIPRLESEYNFAVVLDQERKAYRDLYFPKIKAQNIAARASMAQVILKLDSAQLLDLLHDWDQGKVARAVLVDAVNTIVRGMNSGWVWFDPETLEIVVYGEPVIFHDRKAPSYGEAKNPVDGEVIEAPKYVLDLGSSTSRSEKHFILPAQHTDDELRDAAQWVDLHVATLGNFDSFLRNSLDADCFVNQPGVSASAYGGHPAGKSDETPAGAGNSTPVEAPAAAALPSVK